MSMGFHKNNIIIMNLLEQQQGIRPHMNYILPLSYWNNWHIIICHHQLSTIIVKLGKHGPQP
jgi:hypothetical protein